MKIEADLQLVAGLRKKARIARATKANMAELRARVTGVGQRLVVIKADPTKQDRIPNLIEDTKALGAELQQAFEYYNRGNVVT